MAGLWRGTVAAHRDTGSPADPEALGFPTSWPPEIGIMEYHVLQRYWRAASKVLSRSLRLFDERPGESRCLRGRLGIRRTLGLA